MVFLLIWTHFWDPFGTLWAHFGAPVAQIGILWARFGAFVAQIGFLCLHFGLIFVILHPLGYTLDHFEQKSCF